MHRKKGRFLNIVCKQQSSITTLELLWNWSSACPRNCQHLTPTHPERELAQCLIFMVRNFKINKLSHCPSWRRTEISCRLSLCRTRETAAPRAHLCILTGPEETEELQNRGLRKMRVLSGRSIPVPSSQTTHQGQSGPNQRRIRELFND